jgi:hypothetical protein
MASSIPKKRAPMMLLAACALGAAPQAACGGDDSFDDGADAAVIDSGVGDVDYRLLEGNIFPPYDSGTDAENLADATDAADDAPDVSDAADD